MARRRRESFEILNASACNLRTVGNGAARCSLAFSIVPPPLGVVSRKKIVVEKADELLAAARFVEETRVKKLASAELASSA